MYISRSVRRGIDGKQNILRYLRRTGCTPAGAKLWTNAEKSVVRDHWPDLSEIQRQLPQRTLGAIKKQAGKMRLTKPGRVWKSDDARRLPPPYKSPMPIDEVAQLFPGRSKRQIWSKGYHLHVRRPRRPLKATGFVVLDLIRERAFKMGYTMAELNEWTGFKWYWRGPRQVNWLAVDRALRVLGGTIMPVWPC